MMTVLDNEVDILVSLCLELVKFHELLIPMDLELTCMVWKVYLKLTSTHQAWLVDRFNFTMATEVVSSELYVQMVQLRQMRENSSDEGKGMTNLKVLLQLLISLGSTSSSCVGNSPFFLSFMLEMLSGLSVFAPLNIEDHTQELDQEVMCVSVMHSLFNMASNQPFICFILNFFIPEHPVKQVLLAKPFMSIQLLVNLILQQPGQEDQLLLLSFHLLSFSSSSMEKYGCIEAWEVMSKSITTVDKYTWVLTSLCTWVSSISQSQLQKVEKVLITVLLDSSSSPLTCMMVSDIWCFLAKYGTSNQCWAYLNLLSSILIKVKLSTFSPPVMFITILIDRLTNFLSPIDKTIWQSCGNKQELDQMPALSSADAVRCLQITSMDKDSLATIVKNTWRRLVEGSYKPADRLSSSRLMMALSSATLVVLDTFSTQDVASLMEHMKTVAVVGQCRPFLLVCLVKVVACKKERQLNQLLIEAVMNNIITRQGEGTVGVLLKLALGETQEALGDVMNRWSVHNEEELKEVDIDNLLGGGWTAEFEEDLIIKVNYLQVTSLSPVCQSPCQRVTLIQSLHQQVPQSQSQLIFLTICSCPPANQQKPWMDQNMALVVKWTRLLSKLLLIWIKELQAWLLE